MPDMRDDPSTNMGWAHTLLMRRGLNMNVNEQNMYELCKKHLNNYVRVKLNDGNELHGIIVHVDVQTVTIDVPEQAGGMEAGGRIGGYGYGFYPYGGFYPGFGFRRLILPLAAITALATLPYFWW